MLSFQLKPRIVYEAFLGDYWMIAMQEELNQFKKNQVWELVPRPSDGSIIETKWVFKNKKDEDGKVVRNKACLAAQGYDQQEGIDYDETYAAAIRLESIRLVLAFASNMKFQLYQIDVKSVILNGYVDEEVYVKQPLVLKILIFRTIF